MRIAQIAPLYEAVPPKLYGGTERVVYALVEELVRRGHEVTLFASADSKTSARLVPMAEGGLRLHGTKDPLALHVAMLEEVYAQADRFDVIHSHVDYLTFQFARRCPVPTVTTLHGRLDLPETRRVLSRYPEQWLVSISEAQRQPLADLPLRWVTTVYNGIRLEHFPFRAEPDDPPYLVFLGRISPEKGPLQAIEVARRAGLHLKIAAKIDPADRKWAEANFLPLLDTPGVEYLGEVDEQQKAELLGGALALLFPIDWPEPFGLVMIESMACGTPVIAFPGGSVDEIVMDGVTGLVCRSRTVEEMVAALKRVDRIDRTACRHRVEQYFSSRVMAERYEAVYRQVVAESLAERLDVAIAGADGRLVVRAPRGRDGRPLFLTARVTREGRAQCPVDEKAQDSLDWYDHGASGDSLRAQSLEVASLGEAALGEAGAGCPAAS